MTIDVPQHILDALTDVDMPRLAQEAAPSETIRLAGIDVPSTGRDASSLDRGQRDCGPPWSSIAVETTSQS